MPEPKPRPSSTTGSSTVATEAVTALVLLCDTGQPHRIGECLLLFPEDLHVKRAFGRLGPDTSPRHLVLYRDRPTGRRATGPAAGRHISRTQLYLRLETDGAVSLHNVGRCPMRVNGVLQETARVSPGDLLDLGGRMLFLCVQRTTWPPYWARVPLEDHPFGRADRHGIVGESEVAWRLRARLSQAAQGSDGVLLVGPSGAGRHRAAQALVAMRAPSGPFVHVPPARLREVALQRALQRARGGTVFFEEVALVSPEAMPSLAEAIRQGASSAHRLDGRGRPARVVAATRFKLDALPAELHAAFRFRVPVAPLTRRLDDVPLVARHIAQLRHPGLQWRVGVDATERLLALVVRPGTTPAALHEAIDEVVQLPAPSGEADLPGADGRTVPPE